MTLTPVDVPVANGMPMLGLGTWHNDDHDRCVESVATALGMSFGGRKLSAGVRKAYTEGNRKPHHMAAATEQGLSDAIKYDLRVMHETWMEFVFPRQRGAENTVLGKWQPEETHEVFTYRLWWWLGVPLISIVYPMVLLGYFLRHQTRRINVTAARLGFFGVVLLFTLLWGGLTAIVYIQLQSALEPGAVTALTAASIVAVASSALSYIFWRVGGRGTTVLLAYPFAMTAIFLPPVVAALFWEPLGEVIIQQGEDLFTWVFQSGPDEIMEPLGDRFDRQEYHHAIIWFAVSFPVGWVVGTLVTLADLIRPKGE